MAVLKVGWESLARLLSVTHSSSENRSPLSELCWVWAGNITCPCALLLILAAKVGPPISSENETAKPFPDWVTRVSALSSPNISNITWDGYYTPTPPWTGLFSIAGVGGGMNRQSNVISMSSLHEKLNDNLLISGTGGSPWQPRLEEYEPCPEHSLARGY